MVSRIETLLNALVNDKTLPEDYRPMSRNEAYLYALWQNGIITRDQFGEALGQFSEEIDAACQDINSKLITCTNATANLGRIYKIVYGNGMFVAIGDKYKGNHNSTSNAWYSSDGISWDKTTMPITTVWNDVIYSSSVKMDYSMLTVILWHINTITSLIVKTALPGM